MSNVVAVQEGGKVEMSFTPDGMTFPAEKSTVRIEPMKLVVGRGDFVSKVVNLLGLKDRSAPLILVTLPLCLPVASMASEPQNFTARRYPNGCQPV